MIIYFSRLRGKGVIDADGRRVGKLDDILIRDGEKFAEVTHIVLRTHSGRSKISSSDVETFNGSIRLTKPFVQLTFSDVLPGDLSLKETIMDRQLLDINGLKVVRVNDILLAEVNTSLCVISVDAGFHGFMRRLGVPIKIGKEANLIPWEYVEPITTESPLRLKIPKSRISSLHPADLADLLESLSPKQRASVFRRLDEDVAADTLAEIEPEVTKSVIAEVKEKKIAAVLSKMAPDEAADIISSLHAQKAGDIMEMLDPTFRDKVKDLLHYEDKSAGRMMNPDFIAVYSDNTAQEAIEYMRKRSPVADRSYYVYVIDREGRLMGVLSLRELIISPAERKVVEFMKPSVMKVSVNAPREEAAKLIVKFNLSVLPVVDERDKLLGVIAADDILSGFMPSSWRTITPTRKYYLRRRKSRKNGPPPPDGSTA